MTLLLTIIILSRYTINAIASAFIQQKGELGVFEYGIRNIKYGVPDTVQRVVDPIGVVYTTISQEQALEI